MTARSAGADRCPLKRPDFRFDELRRPRARSPRQFGLPSIHAHRCGRRARANRPGWVSQRGHVDAVSRSGTVSLKTLLSGRAQGAMPRVPNRVPLPGAMPKLTDCDGQRHAEIPKDFSESRKKWRARPAYVPSELRRARVGLPAVARLDRTRAKAGAPGRTRTLFTARGAPPPLARVARTLAPRSRRRTTLGVSLGSQAVRKRAMINVARPVGLACQP